MPRHRSAVVHATQKFHVTYPMHTALLVCSVILAACDLCRSPELLQSLCKSTGHSPDNTNEWPKQHVIGSLYGFHDQENCTSTMCIGNMQPDKVIFSERKQKESGKAMVKQNYVKQL